MNHGLLAIGPVLVLLSCVVAVAGDGSAMPTQAVPGSQYLLTLGPYGALVWFGYLLGKGVKITVQVELSEKDRALLESRTKPNSP